MARINPASLRAQLDDCRACHQAEGRGKRGHPRADQCPVHARGGGVPREDNTKDLAQLQSAEFTGRHRQRDPHRGQVRIPRTEGTPRTLRHPAHGHHDAHQPGHRVPAVWPRLDRDRVHRTRAAHRGRHRLRDRRTSGHRRDQGLSALPIPDQGPLPRHHAVRTRDRRLCRAPALCPDRSSGRRP